MDNKDERTFTDLFSSSKEESEIKTQTFSDILNSGINDTNNSSTSMTFDSLFEQIPSKEEEILESEETKVEEDKNRDEETKVEEDEILEKKNQDKEITNFNPLFEENITTNANNNVTNLELKDSVADTPNEKLDEVTNNIEFNPFIKLNESGLEDAPIENNQSKVEDSILGENPFFEEEKKDEISLENNPFFKEENDLSIQNDIDNNNPFMNLEASTSENNTAIEKETKVEEEAIEINPLFKEEQKEKEITLENNPFFKEENNQPSILLEAKKETKEVESIEPKSTSPFFEEEKKVEENPFFQNQLNLIESKAPDNAKGTIDTTNSKHYNVKIVKKKEPLIKLILGVLSYALFIWLLLIGVTLLVYVLDIKIRAAKGDYSSPTFNAYVVLTGSMLPEIEVYDVVVTKKIDAKNLKEGDVITFSSADTRFLNTIITHRIIKKNPPTETEGYTFQTQGDNNNVADSALVPENRIFGKVILKIPKLGYLQDFLASKGGWIIVILIPCLTVISYDTVKLIKGLKKKKYKNIKVQK